MGQIAKMVAASASLSIPAAERLLNGIGPRDFARFARPGGILVKSNHPAFVFGHLALYPARVMQALGQPAGAAACPGGWESLFKNGVECQDDPEGRIYPPMEQITKQFRTGYEAAIDAISQGEDSALLAPNPAEGRMRELFPVVGAALIFYVGGHVHMHLGQVSAWRRMMGLPPAA